MNMTPSMSLHDLWFIKLTPLPDSWDMPWHCILTPTISILSPILHSLLLVQKVSHRALFLTWLGVPPMNMRRDAQCIMQRRLSIWHASPSSANDGTSEWQSSCSTTLCFFADHATTLAIACTAPNAPFLPTTTRTNNTSIPISHISPSNTTTAAHPGIIMPHIKVPKTKVTSPSLANGIPASQCSCHSHWYYCWRWYKWHASQTQIAEPHFLAAPYKWLPPDEHNCTSEFRGISTCPEWSDGGLLQLVLESPVICLFWLAFEPLAPP